MARIAKALPTNGRTALRTALRTDNVASLRLKTAQAFSLDVFIKRNRIYSLIQVQKEESHHPLLHTIMMLYYSIATYHE